MKYTCVSIKDIDIDTVAIKSDPDLLIHERETNILFHEESDIADINSSQKVIIKKLLSHPYFTPDDEGIFMKGGAIVAVKGTIPRNCVSITLHPRKRFDKI